MLIPPDDEVLFNSGLWRPALEKYAAVTRQTVNVYGVGGQVVCGPVHSTPLFALLEARAYDPGIVLDCARQCLAQTADRPAVIVAGSYGLAVVGSSLMLDGEIVGAAVAGYALLDFSQRADIERLARDAGVPFQELWEITRTCQPVPSRRLQLHGELLQVLGDTILREVHRTRQFVETTAELTAAAAEMVVAAAAKDEFLAVLSHELRTPLTPILGWAAMLKGGHTTKIAKAAEVIERNALLQVRLVEDLLELTRVTRGKVTLDMKIADLGDALRAACEAFSAAARQKGISLDFADRADRSLMVNADANRLQQVLRNVLSNAVKFTPTGGRVTMTITEDAGSAVVTVLDTGEGITPDFLPYVFEMFQQQEHGTRRTHDGLGIGLALVKTLTELQGGEVTIASEGLGRGTAVTLRFPLIESLEHAMLATVPAIPQHQALDGLRILVVEDMDDAREMMRLMLEAAGADVLVAKDGRDALEVVEHGKPDLVLCDLRMPRMDGFEFLHALDLQPEGRRLPVIAVSGLASSADHVRTEAAGFEGHVDKPFDDARLLAAIGAVVRRARNR